MDRTSIIKPSLKLVFPPHEKNPNTIIYPKRTILWLSLAFILVKIPMLFVPNNPEELRDFDHFLRTSEGLIPYKDYVYSYGPLAPFFYGLLFKFVPSILISQRILSLFMWGLSTMLLAKILQRYLSTSISIFIGTLVSSSMIGYPSYNHNHVLCALGLIGVCYFILKFSEEKSRTSLLGSYFFALVCLFTRPIPTGYLVYTAWLICTLIMMDGRAMRRVVHAIKSCLGVGVLLLILYKLCGPWLKNGLISPSWLVLPWLPYPNLHFLIPEMTLRGPFVLELFLKEIRAALETSLFYSHYFVWPGVCFTLAAHNKYNLRFKAAALIQFFALCGSTDILHYGFTHPLFQQAVTQRGQFFLSLTAVSLFLVLWPKINEFKRSKLFASLSICILVALTTWGFMPWVVGVYQIRKFDSNPYDFRILKGIFSHRDRQYTFQAVRFIDTICKPGDKMATLHYEPGISRLTDCEDAFEKDVYTFTRWPDYRFRAFEIPYIPEGGMTDEEFRQKMYRETKPRIYLRNVGDLCPACCTKYQDFGDKNLGRRVCWGN